MKRDGFSYEYQKPFYTIVNTQAYTEGVSLLTRIRSAGFSIEKMPINAGPSIKFHMKMVSGSFLSEKS
ncbi:MAG: hypothetical protein GXY34_04810 [Syntrophomonadaceae bacterium]|nr:hypothetical protein [Syntrophomonadaceae bacterium]